MKKIICGIAMLFAALVLISGCNSPTGGGGGDEPPPEEIEITDGGLYVVGNSSNYPGAEVNLNNLLAGQSIADISNYASITVNAILYSDEGGTTVAIKENPGDNLVQFKLLKGTGGWDDASNICGGTAYNMAVNGNTSYSIPPTAQGIPAILLLQANWAEFPDAVKSIKVISITFTPKTSDVVLDEVYDNGSYIDVSGNRITFNNATYSEAAAIFNFPDTFPASLSGKQLVFNFKLEDCSHPEYEHQIHIQAANSDKVKFNGRNTQPGQKYITLDDTATTGWDSTTSTGSFRVPLNDLLAAAEISDNANDMKGPFTLNAVRIVNNGTVWEGHVRDKSYTLIFESITVQ